MDLVVIQHLKKVKTVSSYLEALSLKFFRFYSLQHTKNDLYTHSADLRIPLFAQHKKTPIFWVIRRGYMQIYYLQAPKQKQ